MSWTALICLGASDGARVECVLDAAAALLSPERWPPGQAPVLRACSDLYGDRHRAHRGGATINLILALDCGAALSAAQLEAAFKRLEAEAGRERDPRRAMPVPLDIDLLGRLDAAPHWQPRYDPGRAYLFHGLHQLPLAPLRQALDALAVQRGFAAATNASGFYPLAGAGFIQRWLGQCAAAAPAQAREALS